MWVARGLPATRARPVVRATIAVARSTLNRTRHRVTAASADISRVLMHAHTHVRAARTANHVAKSLLRPLFFFFSFTLSSSMRAAVALFVAVVAASAAHIPPLSVSTAHGAERVNKAHVSHKSSFALAKTNKPKNNSNLGFDAMPSPQHFSQATNALSQQNYQLGHFPSRGGGAVKTTANEFTDILQPPNTKSFRSFHVGATLTPPGTNATSMLIVFGGLSATPNTALGDTWIYNTTTHVWSAPPPQDAALTPRLAAASTAFESGEDLFMFGGISGMLCFHCSEAIR